MIVFAYITIIPEIDRNACNILCIAVKIIPREGSNRIGDEGRPQHRVSTGATAGKPKSRKTTILAWPWQRNATSC
jgi:hypothetical protein